MVRGLLQGRSFILVYCTLRAIAEWSGKGTVQKWIDVHVVAARISGCGSKEEGRTDG